MPDPIRKIALSRYAVQRLAAHPEFAAEVNLEHAAGQPFSGVAIRNALAGSGEDDEDARKRRLRRLRQRVLLREMARDLENAADLAEVCGTMRTLAQASTVTASDCVG